MAFRDEFDDSVPKEYGMFWGSVVRNDDPEKLGRVKVYIPGVLEPESPWAWPVGSAGAGAEQQGLFAIPRPQATVLCGFVQGDKSEVFYMPGPWRIRDNKSGIPAQAEAETDVEEVPNVRAFETESFEIVIKDTEEEKKLILRSKDGENEVEIDAEDKSISINAGTTLILNSVGIIDIRAPRVQIGNRIVLPFGNPI